MWQKQDDHTQEMTRHDVTQHNKSATDSDSAAGATELDFVLHQPDDMTLVCGTLEAEHIQQLAESGVQHIINLQSDAELASMGFDEAQLAKAYGMGYSHLAIADHDDLTQVKMLAFDRLLREQQGQKIAIHCSDGDRVGAAVALRSGWLRGRKMDTALARGEAHGLTSLKQEVHMRLLVPR